MSDAVENSHEVDAGLIIEDPATGAAAGVFVTGLLPHVYAPDAKVGSICVRRVSATESVRYKALKDNPTLSTDWAVDEPGAGNSAGIPEVDVAVNGFVDRTQSTISFNESTRLFTITPTGASYDIYRAGIKITITTAKTFTWSTGQGLHVMYFDANGNIQEETAPVDLETIIEDNCLIAVVYWDAVNSEIALSGDERHGMIMDSRTHLYNHITTGTRYATGIEPSSVLADEDGSSLAHVRFATSAGVVWDEDLEVPIPAHAVDGGLVMFYKTGDGSPLEWHRLENVNTLVYVESGNNRPSYNEWTGTAWKLTEITNGKFMNTHVIATNDINSPLLMLMGDTEYQSVGEARDGATSEIWNLDLKGQPGPEFKACFTFIIQSSNSYTNSVNSRIRVVTASGGGGGPGGPGGGSAGDLDFFDWRNLQDGAVV